MGDAPMRLVPWRNFLVVVLLVFGWAGYRVYRDYQQAGRWEERNVIPVAITLCTALLIVGGMFWYANRPEGDRRP